MGRSVSRLRNADEVFYYDASWMGQLTDPETGEYLDEWDETGDQGRLDFEWALELFQDQAKEALPSLFTCDRWEDLENNIVLENDFVEVAVSEYCGLVAVSARTKEPYYSHDDYKANLAPSWLKKVAGKLQKAGEAFGTGLNRIGTFSNGEAVYKRKVV